MPQGIDTWWEHLVDALAAVGDVTERRPQEHPERPDPRRSRRGVSGAVVPTGA
jgi:hypothetical protein